MTPAKDQGEFGTCWAFAAVGLLEALTKRETGNDLDLSEQYLISNVDEHHGLARFDLGVILWTSMGTWIALPDFTIGLVMLPIAYVGWFLLQNSSRFLGEDRPRGRSAVRWNIVLGISLLVTLASVAYTLLMQF